MVTVPLSKSQAGRETSEAERASTRPTPPKRFVAGVIPVRHRSACLSRATDEGCWEMIDWGLRQ